MVAINKIPLPENTGEGCGGVTGACPYSRVHRRNADNRAPTNRNHRRAVILGRWMEQDPAQYINGANTYQFVDASPVGNVDAEGLATSGGWVPETDIGGTTYWMNTQTGAISYSYPTGQMAPVGPTPQITGMNGWAPYTTVGGESYWINPSTGGVTGTFPPIRFKQVRTLSVPLYKYGGPAGKNGETCPSGGQPLVRVYRATQEYRYEIVRPGIGRAVGQLLQNGAAPVGAAGVAMGTVGALADVTGVGLPEGVSLDSAAYLTGVAAGAMYLGGQYLANDSGPAVTYTPWKPIWHFWKLESAG